MSSRNLLNIAKSICCSFIFRKMNKNKVKRLIVTKDNKAIGIVSLSDLVNYTTKDKFTETFKQIYEIDKNNHYFNTDIDDFYL